MQSLVAEVSLTSHSEIVTERRSIPSFMDLEVQAEAEK